MVAWKKPQSKYYHSIFYQPVLRSLSPRWYVLRKIVVAGIFLGLLILYMRLPFVAGTWLVVPFLLFISLAIVSHRKVAQHIPTALAITEKLSQEWFNRNIHTPEALREQNLEIQRLRAIHLDKLHPPREPLQPGGGTLYGVRGEDDSEFGQRPEQQKK